MFNANELSVGCNFSMTSITLLDEWLVNINLKLVSALTAGSFSILFRRSLYLQFDRVKLLTANSSFHHSTVRILGP